MKRNEIEISIIIPCYNSQQYIIKNIETIRHILLKKDKLSNNFDR